VGHTQKKTQNYIKFILNVAIRQDFYDGLIYKAYLLKPGAVPQAILISPRWGFPGAVPQAILISPRWGFPGAVPQAILISPRWGYINFACLGLSLLTSISPKASYNTYYRVADYYKIRVGTINKKSIEASRCLNVNSHRCNLWVLASRRHVVWMLKYFPPWFYQVLLSRVASYCVSHSTLSGLWCLEHFLH